MIQAILYPSTPLDAILNSQSERAVSKDDVEAKNIVKDPPLVERRGTGRVCNAKVARWDFTPYSPYAGEIQAAGSAAAELAGAAGTAKRRKAVAAAKPAIVKPSQPADRQLAEFNAEMAELGEDVNDG